MLITVRCPNGHVLHVKDKYAGKVGACPKCSTPVRIPSLAEISGISGRDSLGNGTAPKKPSTDEFVYYSVLHERQEDAAAASSSSLSLMPGKGKLCVACGKTVSQSFSVCPRCGTPISTYHHVALLKEGDTIMVQLVKARILDEQTVKATVEELCKVADLEGQRDFVLNLSRVVALSSLMLGKLVMLHKRLEHEKRNFTLCKVGPELREVLAATRLDQVLQIDE